MKHGKKYVDSKKLVDKTKLYDLEEACTLCVSTAKAKFDETVELHVRLGVDSRHADQQVRGAVVLPHGTGKNVRVLVIAKGDKEKDALEAGATDFITDDEGVFEIRTEPNDCGAVREDLEAKGYAFVSAEVEYVPSTYTALTNPDDIKSMAKMLEMFEDNDDVQAVWHNWENADDAE